MVKRLFGDSVSGGRRAAIAYSRIESAIAAGHRPDWYIRDVLEHRPGLPADRVAEFTPRAWDAARAR